MVMATAACGYRSTGARQRAQSAALAALSVGLLCLSLQLRAVAPPSLPSEPRLLSFDLPPPAPIEPPVRATPPPPPPRDRADPGGR
ncbi:MAG: hypothetical protein K2X76_06545, partial [Sphingomonas sp.]|nr:hypothetical protein [Sphingomonas sp.]